MAAVVSSVVDVSDVSDDDRPMRRVKRKHGSMAGRTTGRPGSTTSYTHGKDDADDDGDVKLVEVIPESPLDSRAQQPSKASLINAKTSPGRSPRASLMDLFAYKPRPAPLTQPASASSRVLGSKDGWLKAAPKFESKPVVPRGATTALSNRAPAAAPAPAPVSGHCRLGPPKVVIKPDPAPVSVSPTPDSQSDAVPFRPRQQAPDAGGRERKSGDKLFERFALGAGKRLLAPSPLSDLSSSPTVSATPVVHVADSSESEDEQPRSRARVANKFSRRPIVRTQDEDELDYAEPENAAIKSEHAETEIIALSDSERDHSDPRVRLQRVNSVPKQQAAAAVVDLTLSPDAPSTKHNKPMVISPPSDRDSFAGLFDDVDKADDDEGDQEVTADTETQGCSEDPDERLVRQCVELSENLRVRLLSMRGAKPSEDKDLFEDMSFTELSQAILRAEDLQPALGSLRLKDYQLAGINWMHLLYSQNLNGILADEMGLGKTVQCAAFLGYLHHSGTCRGPHIVIVPTSTVANWYSEFTRWVPALRVLLYHGSASEREKLQACHPPSKDPFDVLLTSYSYFERSGIHLDRTYFRKFQFQYLVLDEGHCIKNSASTRAQKLSQLRVTRRLLLTGTPVQNNLKELNALLHFLMPNVFPPSSSTFAEHYSAEPDALERVKSTLAPFVLRRCKAQVLAQMPPKSVQWVSLPMHDTQSSLYRSFLREAKGADALSGSSAITLFTNLRKAGNHPLLCRQRFGEEAVFNDVSTLLFHAGAFGQNCTIAMVRKEMASYSDFQIYSMCQEYADEEAGLTQYELPTEDLWKAGKMLWIRDNLPRMFSEGHRVLLFSQWTSMLDVFEAVLSTMGVRWLRLDGSTPAAERQGLIDTFTTDTLYGVFLLSTRAGGLGINLTCADTVIMHDLDFNPQTDAQAEDRCHRLGQTKPVTVYKLVTTGTIEERIAEMAQKKAAMTKMVLEEEHHAHDGDVEHGHVSKVQASAIASLLAEALKAAR